MWEEAVSTARDWFADDFEFRQLCGDAQSQARDESSQEFAAEMVNAYRVMPARNKSIPHDP